MSAGREAGTGGVILLSMLALVALLCLAVADVANVLLARARAQAAADAAALDAAVAAWPVLGDGTAPEDAAARAAEANGAEVVSCDCPRRGPVTVTVSVPTRVRYLGVAPGVVRARAGAELDPGRMFAPP